MDTHDGKDETQSETQSEILRSILDTEVEMDGDKYVIKKKRTAKLPAADDGGGGEFLELDIYLECYQKNGTVFNRAEVFLLSDECEEFTETLIRHKLQLPTSYRQWQIGSSTIVCICMESKELPEHFAERLSATLEAISEYPS